MSFLARRCGVQFNPPSMILIYEIEHTNKIRKRIIPLKNFSEKSDCYKAAERLKNHTRHKAYFEHVSLEQLERLHIILRDQIQGCSLEQSLDSLCLNPEEDLNKLSDKDLNRKKAEMDKIFERNRRHKDDLNFVYDLEVEFTEAAQEVCSWDEESNDGF
ncbi:centrosomal protein of 19 kDa [Hypomesus transpacificus]|uniref:centrosomal protein of 19 kDa n=1 Tax=Hypomesus transpacificus TaxID=137520 RepID=UPI001F072FA5|nr:centrosomal protein of 19 kDa [Hypomesus transpacificus]